MKDYFDKTFFKFLLSFLGILLVALLILFALRVYSNQGTDTGTTVTVVP